MIIKDSVQTNITFFSAKNNKELTVHCQDQYEHANLLEQQDLVKSYQVNVELLDWKNTIYLTGIRTVWRELQWTTDFLIEDSDGKIIIREFISFEEHKRNRARVRQSLEISRRFWNRKNVDRWQLIERGEGK